MKKVVYLLVASLLLQLCVLPAAAAGVDLIIPGASESKNILMQDGFEYDNVQGWSWWDDGGGKPEIVCDTEDLQNPTKVLHMTSYNYFQEGWLFNNFILEFNFKYIKYAENFPAVLLRSGSDKLNMYISGGSSVCIEGAGGSWIGSGDFSFSEHDNEWIYIRIELTDGRIRYYVNDTENPVLDIETSEAEKSYNIGFTGGGYLDNMMISTPAREVPVSEPDRVNNDILAEDTLSEQNRTLWSTDAGETVFCKDTNGETVYAVQGYDSYNSDFFSGLRNYTIEFNLKIDYQDAAGAYGKTWPGIDFRINGDNYYNLYFVSSNSGEIDIERRLNGQTDGWPGSDSSCGALEQQDRWAYMKIEMLGDTVNVYYMNQDTPCISFTDGGNAPAYGGFRFVNGGAAKYYVKNLVVYTKKPADEPQLIPVKDENREELLSQNFSDGAEGFTGGFSQENGVLRVTDMVTSSDEYDDFTLEFNIKNNYIPFGTVGHIYFRTQGTSSYDLQLDSKLSQNRIVLKRGIRTLAASYEKIADRNGEWDYFRIEANGDNIRVYYNAAEEPIMDVTDSAGNKYGTVGFAPATETFIDNVVISRAGTGKRVKISGAAFEDGETVRFTADAESGYDTLKNAVLAIAGFDGSGVLSAINAKMVQLAANDVTSLEITAPAADYHEVYLLDVQNGIHVLADSVLYNRQKQEPQAAGKASEAVLNITAELENELVRVSGSLGDGIQKSVLIAVAKNVSMQSITAETFTPENIAAVTQLDAVEADGSFDAVLRLPADAEEGVYTVYAASVDGIAAASTEITYINSDKLADFVSSVNASTGSALYELLNQPENEKYLKRLGADTNKYYSIVDVAYRLTVCNNYVKNNEGGLDAGEIAAAFNAQIALPYLKDSKSGSEFRKRLEADYDFYGIDETAIEEYKTLGEEVREEICRGLYNNKDGFGTMTAVSEDLSVNIILAQIYLANYTEIYGLLEKYERELGIDISKISNIKDSKKKNDFYMSLNKQRYYNISSFIKNYDSAYAAAAAQTAVITGGGGGGGGSSSSSGFAAPPMQTVGGKEAAAKHFTDIGEGHWAYEAVVYMQENGIISGFEDGSFAPDEEMTREQFVKVLVSAFGLESEGGMSFSDVSESDWSYSCISTAGAMGIISGTDDGLFLPREHITREDVCAVIYRLLGIKDIAIDAKAVSEFEDYSEISDYARAAVSYLADAGIISGVSKGQFAPKSYVTRAAAARIIYGILREIQTP